MIQENVFLLLGSNLGDRLRNLICSIEKIRDQIGSIVNQSTVYETSAWGKTNQPHFFNQALQVETILTPIELLNQIQFIEKSLGRARSEKWDARIIDIDIIYFGDEVIETDTLIVPHPYLAQRRFALIPVTEMRPEFIHPILKKSNQQLLEECTDTSYVNKITG